jgi:hypothetical protein
VRYDAALPGARMLNDELKSCDPDGHRTFLENKKLKPRYGFSA